MGILIIWEEGKEILALTVGCSHAWCKSCLHAPSHPTSTLSSYLHLTDEETEAQGLQSRLSVTESGRGEAGCESRFNSSFQYSSTRVF
jgi:hypothetical protein